MNRPASLQLTVLAITLFLAPLISLAGEEVSLGNENLTLVLGDDGHLVAIGKKDRLLAIN